MSYAIYITFGQIHVHRVNNITFDKDSIAKINCSSYADGREKAFKFFGAKWHNCYIEEDITDKVLSYFPRGILEAN